MAEQTQHFCSFCVITQVKAARRAGIDGLAKGPLQRPVFSPLYWVAALGNNRLRGRNEMAAERGRDRMVRIGTAGWAIPARVRDRFAREGTALERYAQRLPVTEINSTFSRSHKQKTYERWATAVPDEFQFAVKVPKSVTHDRRLADVEVFVDPFLEEVAALGKKLGPLLIQLPPSLIFDASVVRKFLQCIRRRASGPLVCEPRHSSWFLGEAHQLLSDYEVARVAADPARVPEAALPGGSNAVVYYRLHGSPRMYYSEYGAAYARELASRLTAPVAPETWCIFDNTTSGAATLDALALQERVGEELGKRSQSSWL